MQITELVWKLFLILLPGVVSTLMARYINTNKQYSTFEFIIYSATLGIATFVVMELGCSLFWIIYSIFFKKIVLTWCLNLSIWNYFVDGHKALNKNELFISYLLAVPIGFIWGFIVSKKVFIKLLKKLKWTTRYGDEDVWSFYLNSPDTTWVYLHHKKENRTYFGRIRAYSESTEKREILLEDVIVYTTDTWIEQYQSNVVYLELENFDFSIETPKPVKNDNNTEN